MRSLLRLLLLTPIAIGVANNATGVAEQPIWFSGGRPTSAAVSLLRELRGAEARGLRASDYEGARLTEAVKLVHEDTSEAEVLALDHALSLAAARIAVDVHAGRIDPRRLGHDLEVAKAKDDPARMVAALAQTADVGVGLDRLEPRLNQYRLLKAALRHHRELNSRPELARPLPPLPQRSLQTGDVYAGADVLRTLLGAFGDLAEPNFTGQGGPPGVFDATLSQGLRRFQSRHGLAPDGVLGPATFRALTTPLPQRITQIELSLERMRWLPEFDSPPIIVNIPQFRLFAFRTNTDRPEDMLQMDVVVGSSFAPRHTPVFSAEMRYIVLRPYWDVPRSILLEELLPLIRKDTRYLAANDYEIVRGEGDDAAPQAPSAQNLALLARGTLRLRQKPGPRNALGLVKFMLPNRHSVYLHDTPARDLFARSQRDFSHGCIRVSDPLTLIRHVLGDDPRWPTERIKDAMQSGEPTRIALSRRIPVFVLYGTALVRHTGETLFFDDVYGHDARLVAALASRGR